MVTLVQIMQCCGVGVDDSDSWDASQRRRRVGDNNKIETASPNCHNSHNTNYLSNNTTFKHIKEQRGHQGDKNDRPGDDGTLRNV